MKLTHFSRYLKFALFLAILCSFTNVYAYDFEVDGIYYNITSNNTVEVNGGTYGDIIIPSHVTQNGKTYTVTAIGDSAFYYTDIYDLQESNKKSNLASQLSDNNFRIKVTIPQTVSTIGNYAFWNIYIDEVTCFSNIPPVLLGNCFHFHSYGGSYSTSDYAWPPGNEWFYIDEETWTARIRDQRPWTLLCVPSDSYETYKNNSEWNEYFDFIAPIDAPKTDNPTICFSDYDYFISSGNGSANCTLMHTTKCGRYMGYYNVFPWSNGDSGPVSWDCYEPWEGHTYVEFHVSAFAVEEGKRPSDIVSEYTIIRPDDLLDRDVWEEDENMFDFDIDGISYNIVDENSVEVASGIHIHLVRANEYYRTFTVENTILDLNYYYYENDLSSFTERIGDYNNERFVIPSTVTYNGITYKIVGITDNAFSEFERWYECEAFGINEGGDGCVVNSEYCAWLPSCSYISISIPVSISTMGQNKLDDYTNKIILTGEGEWSGGALDVAVQRLDIASGITAIPGLQVNPREVYCYAKVPPTCDENTFTDYTGTLHVPESSLAAYFTAPYWCNFANIVGDAVELTDLTLNKDSAELLVDEQLTLNATIQPANASIDSIIWESSNEEIATVVDGVVTAKSKGECDITVTVLDMRASCHVTVSEVLPTSITLSLESALMEKDSTLTLTATVLPENATYATVTWSSSNSSIATVNSQGIVTAHGVGECDITATCKNLTATCHIKVLERFIYITLDQHRASLLPNHILTLTPTVTPVPTDLVVTSSNPSVAAARLANGKVQVVGVSVGTAIIKVVSADGNAFADSCFVNVYTEAGDVDGDGFVKIDDVTALIDHLLGSDSSIDVGNADLDFDGVVSIADVTGLIDYLLGGGASMSTRETFTVNGVSFTMIRVPAGTFMMGATEEQGSDANSWEKPVHEVTLSNSYLIGETEVTQELWLAVMGTNPSKHEGSLQKPVENVSWLDCQEFISQLNAMTGLTFRMPTEAEWEYAARGANRSRGYKYAGSNDIADVGNVSSSTTLPVGSLQPNELNLYDMSGNVDEWVWDLFGYYTSEPQIDPTGPADGGSDHMYRGGSWYGGANTARVSYRFFRASSFKRGTMGLRLAL